MHVLVIDCRHCDSRAEKEDMDRRTAEEMAAGHSKANPGHSVQVTEVVE